jgi:hypothetical protein
MLKQQQLMQPQLALSSKRQVLKCGDVLMQLQLLLPFAGTWRVTASLGDSMLQHVGDIVAVNTTVQASEQQLRAPLDQHHHPSADTLSQRKTIQLPDAFGSDDEQPPPPFEAPASADEVRVSGATEAIQGCDVEYVLCVRGAGAVTDVGNDMQCYTHSGSRCVFALTL